MRYKDQCPDAAAVRTTLLTNLLVETRKLIKKERNPRKAVAILVNSLEDQEKLRPYKSDIVRLAKCQSADVTQKWGRVLFRAPGSTWDAAPHPHPQHSPPPPPITIGTATIPTTNHATRSASLPLNLHLGGATEIPSWLPTIQEAAGQGTTPSLW